LQHLLRNVALDHGALKGVAVDQHRRLERLEAGDTHGVEDARPRMAEVDLTGGDGSYDLLLGIGGEAARFVDDLDTDVAAGTLLHPSGEVRDRGKVLQVAGGVGHSKDHRLTGAPALSLLAPSPLQPPATTAAITARATVASLIRPFIWCIVPLPWSRVEGHARSRRRRAHRGLPHFWTVASTDAGGARRATIAR